ncbi:MAG: hypothetical protein QOF14_4677 [Hyphomicrobiales bacterium]|nr:hypothetical protein [Hyphomicrobiales bacterium]
MTTSARIACKGSGRSGRPKGTIKVPHDVLQDIWVTVETLREDMRRQRGRRPSVSEACRLIAQRGGVLWLVGGNVDAITRAMEHSKRPPCSDWRRYRLERAGKFLKPVSDKQGRVIASHAIQNARTLRSRYHDANKIVRTEFYVREVWTNFVYDRLGMPRPYLARTRLGLPPGYPGSSTIRRSAR